MGDAARQMDRQRYLGQLYAALTAAIHSGDAIGFFITDAPREALLGIREEAFRQYSKSLSDDDTDAREG